MKPGDYLYTRTAEHGPDGAGVYHYSAMRRLVERVTVATVTLAPAECTDWTCHTPPLVAVEPLEGWRPATHPAWRELRRVRLSERALQAAEARGAALHIEGDGWYYAEAPEIPTEVVPLDTLAERRAAVLVRHRGWCREHGRPEPDVQAELRRYMEAVSDYRQGATA